MVGTEFTGITAVASECITQAEAEVNKYLSPRYDLSSSPFTTSTSIPPMVKTWTSWLAQSFLYEALARGGKDAFNRADRYFKRATDNLKLVAEFKMHVLDSSGAAVAEGSNSNYRILSNTDDYTNTFNEDDELSWAVDSDKLSDIADERD